MLKNEKVYVCDRLVAYDLVSNAEQIMNKTGSITQASSSVESTYEFFDLLLLITKITQKLHPISLNCWDASVITYDYFYDILVEQNGLNPKNYIMNSVYNFGHIFDALRDVYLFIVEDPRGSVDNVHDSGYSLGLAVFYFITPDLAEYDVFNERNQELLDRDE
mmetsp:Transcript_13315/g.22619  ORF Transcript_13315/g.22619 Transcript_13315/m.22619 type:complete len:163 (-) Transcript_13315:88-576(-)